MSLSLQKNGAVATVTLDRPEKRNAINRDMTEKLEAAFADIAEDEAIKVVLLQGAGDRAFSSGADMDEAGATTLFPRRRATRRSPPNIIRDCEKPVIALIRGYAFGGGLEIAAACDIRISADNAVFSYPEIHHGWLPAGGGGTQSLPRLVGMGQAMILVLSGKRIDAAEALRIGLVDVVVPNDDAEATANDLAGEIAQHRLDALILGKAALRMTEHVGIDAGIRYERELSSLCFTFEGRQQALQAFKSRPRTGDEN